MFRFLEEEASRAGIGLPWRLPLVASGDWSRTLEECIERGGYLQTQSYVNHDKDSC